MAKVTSRSPEGHRETRGVQNCSRCVRESRQCPSRGSPAPKLLRGTHDGAAAVSRAQPAPSQPALLTAVVPPSSPARARPLFALPALHALTPFEGARLVISSPRRQRRRQRRRPARLGAPPRVSVGGARASAPAAVRPRAPASSSGLELRPRAPARGGGASGRDDAVRHAAVAAEVAHDLL